MTDTNDENRGAITTGSAPESSLVERSTMVPGLPYTEYREILRDDFLYSCAYCTISEFEAQGIRMTIDHYEPKSLRADLADDYGNIMYCCDDCNMLKGDRCPPQAAREAGHRFFRPDQDYRHEHFAKIAKDEGVHGISTVGEYTVEYLDLNRPTLHKLRRIRERLDNCHRHVVHGVLGLRRFPIDQLPQSMRARAAQRIAQWEDMSENYASDIDAILRGIAYSPLIDRDPEREARAERRAAAHRKLEGLFPGESWRARRRTRRQLR